VPALDNLGNDPQYVELGTIRNFLDHRLVPSRRYLMTIEAGGAGMTGIATDELNISLDTSTTSLRRNKISNMLGSVMDAARSFVDAHF
jgi:hypothetical protein